MSRSYSTNNRDNVDAVCRQGGRNPNRQYYNEKYLENTPLLPTHV